MNPEQLNALGTTLKDAIAVISEKLGVASSHVYEVLIRQQLVEGISALLVPVAAVILSLAFWWSFDSWKEENKSKTWLYKSEPIMPTVTGILALVLSIGTFIAAPMAIGKLMNPEYYALMDIKDMVIQLAR